MSEDAPELVEGPAQDPVSGEAGMDPGDSGEPEEDLSEQIAHWKSMARKWEKSSKANSKAQEELQQLKDAQLSDIDRANKERDDAMRERDEARADHSRLMAAAANNLPVDLIDFLGSGTDEEINERAASISEAIEAEV